MEIWKPITYDGGIFIGKYEISNHAQVRSLITTNRKRRIEPKILKQQISKDGGYLIISLANGDNHKVRKVHALMAKEFIDNPLCKPFVNHKDGNKLNNSLSNLEWATSSENNSHALVIGLNNRNSKNGRFAKV